MGYKYGLGMIWYAPAKRKGKSPVRKVSESTTATGNFLALVHEMHPTATIGQIREIITDKRRPGGRQGLRRLHRGGLRQQRAELAVGGHHGTEQ